jgi:outer membrane protein OmpA-like peptidoglycan-associated protein
MVSSVYAGSPWLSSKLPTVSRDKSQLSWLADFALLSDIVYPLTAVGGKLYKQGVYLNIFIPGKQLFVVNTADFTAQAASILNVVVTLMQMRPQANIFIASHTSDIGTKNFEQQLSKIRAQQVAAYLWAHEIRGFNNIRNMGIAGYGGLYPINTQRTIAAIQSNDRIHITLYPKFATLRELI